MYGKRGRIGLITLASDPTVLPEITRMAPEGVAVYQAPITLPRGEVTPEALAEMLSNDELEQAAMKLAWLDADVLLFACTSGSFIHGSGWDRELIARIERAAGIAATTTSTAVVEALIAIGATSLTIATPYVDEVNQIERRFFESSGFKVNAIRGLGLRTDREIARLDPEDAAKLVREIDDTSADAIFISCTNFHVVDAIDEIEKTQRKPVVTSNQAGAWAALRMLGVDYERQAFGRLFDVPVAINGRNLHAAETLEITP